MSDTKSLGKSCPENYNFALNHPSIGERQESESLIREWRSPLCINYLRISEDLDRVSHVKCNTGKSHGENQVQYIAFF
jgi:hypothetical protein